MMIESSVQNFAFHVGRSVGRYKLESLLGRGAMAEVYKSTHPDLGRDIAVKILHPFHTQMPGFVGRFRLEAQAVASLHHPNIVQVYDFAVSDDGLYYMVMQYINGLSLEEYLTLEKAPLSLSKAFWFFRQFANALHFAHQRGTIHRDVKPANIMLDTRENAYLSDFGLAKIVGVDRQTLSGMNPGTPSYMAPEHISGKAVTPAVDIYAMGVILYRMLTNRLPFEGDNLMTIITRTLTESPTPPREFNPNIPSEVEAVIIKAMSANPQERFPDAAAMSRALADAIAVAGGTVLVQPIGTPVGVIPLPGLELDNYKIKREFIRDSANTNSRVFQRYLAHNIALDNQAVLMVLKMSAGEDSNFIGRFQKRMDALALLDHPGLAAITRVDKTPMNQPYVAYEFIPGYSLETKLDEWYRVDMRLPVREALNFVRQIAEPLVLAHEAGVIHNDLRPENIIVREEEDIPVLVGLEIPIAPDASVRSDAVKVLDYASPEQLEGQPIDERSNVYSLGVMLYELLAGHRPILDWDALDEARLPQPMPLEVARRGLALEIYELVLDCLRGREDGRIADVKTFIERLDRAVVAEQALQETAGQVSLRRRRVFTAVPAAIFVIFLLSFIFFRGQATPLEETVTPETILIQEPATAVPSATHTPESTPFPSPTVKNSETDGVTDVVSDDAPPLDLSPTLTPTSVSKDVLNATIDLPKIPTATATPACEKPPGWITYNVQQGEVLFTLAFNAGMSSEAVAAANCLDSNILSIGQEIWLPSFPATATPDVTNTPLPTSGPGKTRGAPTRTPPPPPTP